MTLKITHDPQSAFHAGEQAAQERVGARSALAHWGEKAIRPFFLEQHQSFFCQLPFIVASARDQEGLPWLTLLADSMGFIRSPDKTHLHLATHPIKGDALEQAFTKGAEVGLVGIELSTRRRNRTNGRIEAHDEDGITFTVSQSYGNCPQYISERDWRYVDVDESQTSVTHHQALTAKMKAWIRSADTLFLASGHSEKCDSTSGVVNQGMDASHRGGAPGFVTILNDNKLVIPDYSGNNFFNTLGNLLLDPSIGLLFIDFENGSLLQLTGRASIDWESEEIQKHPGALRLLNITIDKIVQLEQVLPLRWYLPKGLKGGLRVSNKTVESDDVTSFTFVSSLGEKLPTFRAGQHLPIQLSLTDNASLLERSYSLSNSPQDSHYRISVKRESRGLGSSHLHNTIQVGDIVQAKKPSGDFLLKFPTRPVVLISAGIGVTPLMSMLYNAVSFNSTPWVHFFYGARNGRQAPLLTEIKNLQTQENKAHLTVFFSQPNEHDHLNQDYDIKGRITAHAIQQQLDDLNADFYLCGPTSFLSELITELENLGVTKEQIHYEHF
ncbi:pyridoxamine 5'-phosphate oxidase family protein [Marinomonas arenicola]|uniref:Pyridoxamine 5'-phosphate oxidase family protein n=1 Tax=Marinomonas arenicola TaxID=569601 RepID=A0ABU9G5W0_9GAMM